MHETPNLARAGIGERAIDRRRSMNPRLVNVVGACTLTAALILSMLSTAVYAATADLPDPCSLVPPALVASTFGVKTAPGSSDFATSNTSTCSYKNGQLTIELGYTALTSPQAPLKTSAVAGLPHGQLYLYSGSESQIVFFRGTRANGMYAVIRNFAKVPSKKLEKLAKALNAHMTGLTGSGGTHIIG